jgi:hypothetical protein
LDNHVAPPDQFIEDLDRGRLLEIERERFLAPVEPDEVGGEPVDGGVVVAGEIAAARPLDLDYPRSEIAQMAGAERPRHRLLQREHGDAGQGKS